MFAACNLAAGFAQDVREGLGQDGQKTVPSKYLYDELGSRLFDAITALPEYGLTRADERVICRLAPEAAAGMPEVTLIAELGSGSGSKTRCILESFGRDREVRYCPIEISSSALKACRRELSDLPSVRFEGVEREYLEGLRDIAARRRTSERMLVLFLGSTIGNFEPPEDISFLREVRRLLQPGDALLLGTDLVKPVQSLLDAYDDPLGVTAAFNRNLLARMNRELAADFDLNGFRHRVRYNEETGSVEMHLEARWNQRAVVRGADLRTEFRDGETIRTESSHKYSHPEVQSMVEAAGYSRIADWTDSEWPFSETLVRVC